MTTSIYNFKQIAPVPTGNDFLDIILSKTQRKTPTVCSLSIFLASLTSLLSTRGSLK